jgi:hypothetical protein
MKEEKELELEKIKEERETELAKAREQRDKMKEEKELELEKIKEERETELAKAREQRDKMKEEKDLELTKLREENEAKLTALKEDKEVEMEKIRLEREKIAMQERVEANKLEAQKMKSDNDSSQSKAKCKLPMFNEEKDKFDAYISRFESVAGLRGWKKTEWPIQLSMLLAGKALDAFYGLSEDEQKDYDVVKEALLRKYQLTEDEFRKQFFTTKVETGETPTQYITRIRRLFSKWVELTKIEQSFDGICSLIIREQFLRRCHVDLAAYLREKKVAEITELAQSAQRYIDAHGGTMTDKVRDKKKDSTFEEKNEEKTFGNKVSIRKDRFVCNFCKRSGHTEERCWVKNGKPEGLQTSGGYEKRCFLCNSTDHLVALCPRKKEVASMAIEVPTANTCSCVKSHVGSACISAVLREVDLEEEQPTVIQMEGQEYVVHKDICENPVSICTCLNLPTTWGIVNGISVKALRDSGCSGIVVKSELVQPMQYTSKYKDCLLIDGTVRRFPVAWIQVESDYVNGMVEALVTSTPVFDLIIGNVNGAKMPKNEDENQDRYDCDMTRRHQIAKVQPAASETDQDNSNKRDGSSSWSDMKRKQNDQDTREDQEVHAAMVMVLKDGTRYADEEVEDSQELLEVCPLKSTQSWKDVNINEKLSKEQQEEIGDLLREYQDVLTTLPGHTEVEKHCIYTTSEGTN